MNQVQSKVFNFGIWSYEDGFLLGLQSFLAEQSPTILSHTHIYKNEPQMGKNSLTTGFKKTESRHKNVNCVSTGWLK